MKRIIAVVTALAAASGLALFAAGPAAASSKPFSCSTNTTAYSTSIFYTESANGYTIETAYWSTNPNASMDRLTWSYRINGGSPILIAAAGAASSTQNDVSGSSGAGGYSLNNYILPKNGNVYDLKASAWGGVGSDNSSCGSSWVRI